MYTLPEMTSDDVFVKSCWGSWREPSRNAADQSQGMFPRWTQVLGPYLSTILKETLSLHPFVVCASLLQIKL